MSKETLSAEELYEKGRQLESEGKYRQALQYYVEAQKRNPKIRFVYTAMGNSYLKVKDPERAIKAYKRSIRETDDSNAYHNLGMLYYHLKMYNKAAENLLVAEKKGHSTAEIYYILGRSLFHNKQFDQALKIVTKGYTKTQNPQLKEIRDKLKKETRELAEKFPGVNVLKSRIKKTPGNLKNYNSLVIHYGNMNDLKSAEEMLRLALKNNKRSIAAFANLAAFLIDKGRYKEASETLEIAIKSCENDKSSACLNLYTNLANTYLKIDEKKKARKVLEKALSMEPPKKELLQKMLDGI